ncbi:MAG: AgmX/PglI C-terminal domain-containing protein [bacterium]
MTTIIQNVKIGLLHDGKLINEVVVSDTKDVFIGTSLDNTITINDENFDDMFKILYYIDDQYYLNLHKGIEGKLFEGSNELKVKDLVKNPSVIQKDDLLLYPLSNESRGLLTIGKNAILFKLYSSEAIPKSLPKEFRGDLFGGYFDLSFFLIFMTLATGYIVLISSFGNVKPSKDLNFDRIPEKFARLIMDNPLPVKKEEPIVEQKIEQKEEKPEKDDNEKKIDSKATQKTEGKVLNTNKDTIRSGGGSDQKREISEVVRSSGIIGIIGSKGKSGNVANLFQEQGFNNKLDKALKGVSGLYAGTSVKEAKMKRGSGDATGIEIGSLKATTGLGLVAFGAQSTSASNILGEIGSKDIEGTGSINPSAVAKALAQHIGAFQYCYNRALQGNPRLKGELKVRFTILSSGFTDRNGVSFTGPASRDTGLTSCISRVFQRIKFPSPKGGEVIVSYPMNFTAQN